MRDSISASETLIFGDIPRIDMAVWDRASTVSERLAIAAEVRAICHEIGFFYLVNHAVDPELLTRYMSALKQFFALPIDVKRQIDKANSPQFRGWERLGSELTNDQVDHREQLDIGTERAVILRPEPFYHCLIGPNQWPPESALPGFRKVVESYLAAVGKLARSLLQLLSLSLDLPENAIEAVFGAEPQPYCKLICYPPTPANAKGVGAHKDSGFLTLLLQDDVGGLQAQNAVGTWVDIAPVENSFVVNIGELLQIMTHNYFVATPHRVVNTQTNQVRYSSAYFYSPDLDTELLPLPLDDELRAAVRASARHSSAGLMASRQALLDGSAGMSGRLQARRFGEQYWQRWVRSYPDIAKKFYPHYVD